MRNSKRRESVTEASAETTAANARPASADHDTIALSVGNINRHFTISDPTNGPSTIFRTISPFAAIYGGFSSGDISDQDTLAAVDTSIDDPTSVLYPITPAAQTMEMDVFPIVQQLLESGTGQRYNISFSEFVRYVAMTNTAFMMMRSILTINTLAYHFDWKTVFPHTDVVPPHIYALAKQYDATDVGLASRWVPLFRRLETKMMMPRQVEDIKRQLTPMLTTGPTGRLLIPIALTGWVQSDAGAVQADVEAYLNYIEVNLAKTGNVLTSFLPFTIGTANPWDVSAFGGIDILREAGWWNSGARSVDTFGDTSDPSKTTETVVVTDRQTEDTIDPAIWHSMLPQPTWGEVKNATIWNLHENVLDNTYALLTMHQLKDIIILEEESGFVYWDGSPYTDSSSQNQYEHFSNSRYCASTPVVYGRMRSSSIGAELTYGPLKRLIRTEVRFIFSVELLVQIAQNMSGASLRELRNTIRDMTLSSLKSPY
jgi:hypothetical protein